MNRYVYNHPKSNMPKKMSRMRGPILAAMRGDQKLRRKFQTQSMHPVRSAAEEGFQNTHSQHCPKRCTSVAHAAGNSQPSTPYREDQLSVRLSLAGQTHQGVGPQNAPYVKTCMIAKAMSMSPPCLLRGVSWLSGVPEGASMKCPAKAAIMAHVASRRAPTSKD